MALAKSQKSLKKWTKQEWGTKSGTKAGKQHSAQPKKIAKKTKTYRS